MSNRKRKVKYQFCKECNRTTVHVLYINGMKRRPVIVCTCCNTSYLKRA